MSEFFSWIINQITIYYETLLSFDYLWVTVDFLSSLTFEDFIKIIVIYLVLLWASIVVWVTKDIINRTDNILFQIVAILTVLIWTPLGLILYFLIRPSKTLFERHYEEWDYEMEDNTDIEQVIKELERVIVQNSFNSKCRSCWFSVKKDYKFCPNCRIDLIKRCNSCDKSINDKWDYCPHCWHDQDDKVTKILEVPKLIKKVSDSPNKSEEIKAQSENKKKDENKTKEVNTPIPNKSNEKDKQVSKKK